MPPTATEAPLLPPARRHRPGGSAPAPAAGLRRRLARSLRGAAPALLAYGSVRAFSLLVLAVWAHRKGHGVWPTLATQWDAKWYLGIADHGYAVSSAHDFHNLAFFPLYPVLVKAVAAVTPGSRASVGLVVAGVSSFVAAWGIFAVGERLHGRRAGVLLAFLWACLPVGIVQWMGYTESLFTACAAWSLYAVLTGRWVSAGALSVLAGLTRPTGIALAAAVSLSALPALRSGLRWRPAAGALFAPLGWLAFVGWAGHRIGRWDGYFEVQRRLWKNQWDGGLETLRRMREYLAYDSVPDLFLVCVSVTLIVAVVLFAICVWDRQPLPLLVFSGALLTIVLGSGGVYFPRARFLVPAFPLLLPIALAMARAASRRALVLGVAGAVVTGAYGGAYMLLVYTGAP
ncbi:hypothetical protein [Streptomyces beihaiensis]|uniref:Integral membrane protein n=1 Tax=Streptomyces beihaiensis TaxID=2984495 RepID=A0ABT3TSI6_9ACTN|nr:hypothetical protein [Streptomyces beihaiensis]MCX3059382.1 hypothetical protein [Streptomyces beihaiensis]